MRLCVRSDIWKTSAPKLQPLGKLIYRIFSKAYMCSVTLELLLTDKKIVEVLSVAPDDAKTTCCALFLLIFF